MTLHPRPFRARGQALVEFALVLPVFLLLVLGLFDVGRAVFAYNTLTNAAREAARLAVVNQDAALIASRAEAIATGVDVDTAAPDFVAFYRKGPNADVETNDACDGSTEERELTVGCVVVVKPSTQWQAVTPIIGSVIGPITMEARAEFNVEFVCPNVEIPEIATSTTCPKQP